ncbi:1-phosphofructokinase [Mesoplasma corruscae]|uniref:1-phosphofructokinase n=1 Tax=Mesoplasma corruscae TaxID=216874 RepID=A0A2S5RH91_9MOLU|nr:1-phosphofructokinase [Mesoplasma corruscae]PPE06495.1 1-phosphofructokinase [Mesoplasma corruscae]
MIYTITLNPALDHTIETNKFNLNETNYYQRDYKKIGGKGINTAIILNNLNANVISVGILGEENKHIFIEEFNKIGLSNHFILNKGVTRTNFKIKNLAKKSETELNGVGSEVSKHTIHQLLEFLEKKIQPADIVIASGSLPIGINNNIYNEIGNIVNDKKGMFILDTSKENMINGLKAKPFLIKPNIEEICEILNVKFKEYSFDEVQKMIQQLKDMGARNVLFSMGSKGSYYFSENNEIFHTGIATGKLVNSVGSGDSMIGGFTYGLSLNLTTEESLQYASAAGGATAFSEGLGSREEIEKLFKTIQVKRI